MKPAASDKHSSRPVAFPWRHSRGVKGTSLQASAANEDLDSTLELDGERQGVRRITAALQAHAWSGLTLKCAPSGPPTRTPAPAAQPPIAPTETAAPCNGAALSVRHEEACPKPEGPTAGAARAGGSALEQAGPDSEGDGAARATGEASGAAGGSSGSGAGTAPDPLGGGARADTAMRAAHGQESAATKAANSHDQATREGGGQAAAASAGTAASQADRSAAEAAGAERTSASDSAAQEAGPGPVAAPDYADGAVSAGSSAMQGAEFGTGGGGGWGLGAGLVDDGAEGLEDDFEMLMGRMAAERARIAGLPNAERREAAARMAQRMLAAVGLDDQDDTTDEEETV